jgi:DNA-binding beta-propeller fold protein YncE
MSTFQKQWPCWLLLLLCCSQCKKPVTFVAHQPKGGVSLRTCPVPNVVVSTFAGTGVAGFLDGTVSVATMRNPNSVAVDNTTGVIYFSDQGNHCIRKIFKGPALGAPWQIVTIAGNGTAGLVNGSGAGARFNNPMGIALDNLGNIIVADNGNNAIRKVTPLGVVTTITGGIGAGMVDGPLATAKFNGPVDVAVDQSTNDIYISDLGNNRIRKAKLLSVVATMVGGGGPSASETGSSPVRIINCHGVDFDEVTGEIWFTDVHSLKSSRLGIVTKYAAPAGVCDGLPLQVKMDNVGYLYYTVDNSGGFGPYHIIQFDRATNTFLDLAGGTPGTFFDGLGFKARFNRPWGLAVDPAGGSIYVCDNLNMRLRLLTLSCP